MAYQWTEKLSIPTNGANCKASMTNGDFLPMVPLVRVSCRLVSVCVYWTCVEKDTVIWMVNSLVHKARSKWTVSLLHSSFSSMWTLNFKAHPTNAFCHCQSIFGSSSQLLTAAECVAIKSSSTVQKTKQCSVVVVSWVELPNIWMTVAKNAFNGWAVNFRVCVFFKGAEVHPSQWTGAYICVYHSCHRHHFSNFSGFSFTKIKLPWPKNTKRQI